LEGWLKAGVVIYPHDNTNINKYNTLSSLKSVAAPLSFGEGLGVRSNKHNGIK